MDLNDILGEQYPDWDFDDDGAAMTCPHGKRLEPDGQHDVHPDERLPGDLARPTCYSPLITEGMI